MTMGFLTNILIHDEKIENKLFTIFFLNLD